MDLTFTKKKVIHWGNIDKLKVGEIYREIAQLEKILIPNSGLKNFPSTTDNKYNVIGKKC